MKNTLVIAEVGVNHNGDLETAKRLITEASNAGADVVKFQTFKTNSIATPSAEKANYQKLNTKNNSNQIEMLNKLELRDEEFVELSNHCKKNKIEFLSTAFDPESLDMLISLGIKRIKVPSGEITNFPFLKKIGSKNLPIILSTGMSTLGEIEDALNLLLNSGSLRKNITVLHCTSEYPAPYGAINLRAMNLIKNAFNVKIGYSDHTLGIEVSLAAVALGAKIIEKHITLDKNSYGPDHKASLEPKEFNKLVNGIRIIEKSLGDGIKRPTNNEISTSKLVRKSIVASKKIKKGEKFTEYNLTTKRPFTGISPMLWDQFIGKTSTKEYDVDDLIN